MDALAATLVSFVLLLVHATYQHRVQLQQIPFLSYRTVTRPVWLLTTGLLGIAWVVVSAFPLYLGGTVAAFGVGVIWTLGSVVFPEHWHETFRGALVVCALTLSRLVPGSILSLALGIGCASFCTSPSDRGRLLAPVIHLTAFWSCGYLEVGAVLEATANLSRALPPPEVPDRWRRVASVSTRHVFMLFGAASTFWWRGADLGVYLIPLVGLSTLAVLRSVLPANARGILAISLLITASLAAIAADGKHRLVALLAVLWLQDEFSALDVPFSLLLLTGESVYQVKPIGYRSALISMLAGAVLVACVLLLHSERTASEGQLETEMRSPSQALVTALTPGMAIMMATTLAWLGRPWLRHGLMGLGASLFAAGALTFRQVLPHWRQLRWIADGEIVSLTVLMTLGARLSPVATLN